ncbi:1-phosphofructokinase [Alkalibacillus aidingensis]|uniref:1-phosphofructokinase n=1 Tax=Alkalibacillus aidingensis TaxID=2747607 RepID=UPI001660A5FA|nr:1-phosphofructokinase [Alkalibacillus aidingensis]
MTKVLTMTLNPAIDKTLTLSTFEVGGLNRLTTQPHIDPGGKGINVAKVLNHLNTPVTTTGFMAGQTGKKMMNELQSLGIKTSFQDVDGEVRTNLKIVDQETQQTTEINEPGFVVGEEDLEGLNLILDQLLDQTEVMILAGSTPKGVSDHIYKEYIEKAKAKGVRTILDVSGNALKEGLKAKPFAIKPNIHELEDLFSRQFNNRDEIVEACEQLVKEGIELVVVSLGGDGALFVSEDEVYQVAPFDITPKSTVGAGDSMVGAMVYSLLNSYSLEDLAKWSTTAGTITASKAGTSVCTLSEIEEYVDQVKVRKI